MISLAKRLARAAERASLTEATKYAPAVSKTLRALEDWCYRQTGNAARFRARGNTYMFEWPDHGQTEDGIVEAPVYRRAGDRWVSAGTYRIGPDGSVLRFPGLPPEGRRALRA